MVSSWKTTFSALACIAVLAVKAFLPDYAEFADEAFMIFVAYGLLSARDYNK
jgi:hypothetical protein